jgi:hypothetical protein
MSSNYPQRNKDLNMETTVGVRVLKSQREKLEEHALKNKMRISDIIREAITMWLNMNSKE